MKQAIRLFSLVLVLLPAAAIAQIGTATLLGTVNDSTGAPISGASVVIKNSATGITREFVTGGAGNFEFPYLAPGIYQVTTQMTGFETRVVNNYSLEVGQRARLDLTLAPGRVTQEVQVNGSSPLINTESATVGQVIDSVQVAALPLNGRDWIQLAMVAPGVLSADAAGTNADFFGQGGSISVNGGRQQDNNFTIDGTDNNDLLFGGFGMNLSVEAIQEFKVQNDMFSAEYGRSGGAQLDLTTKSGGNAFHGDVFEFVRNSYFDAQNFFSSATPPPLARNQFGGILGGPIKRDRVFFFVDYEGQRQAEGLTSIQETPTANQRQGIFGSTTIIDPTTNAPFPDNTIPPDRISSIASQILSLYYPLPNVSGQPGYNYARNFNTTTNIDQFTVRVDWKVNDKDTIFGRVSHYIENAFSPGPFGQFGNSENVTPTNATFDNTYTFSSRQINEFRFGVNRPLGEADYNQCFGSDLITPLGIQGIVPVSTPQYVCLPYIGIAGYAGIGPNYYAPVADFATFVDFLDDHTYIKGKHSIKVGVEIKNQHQYNQTGIGINGSLGFNPVFTGNGLGDFLLGLPNGTQIGVGSSREYLQSLGQYYYAMDDWNVRNGLTLNLGVRYEYNPPFVEKQNRLADFSQAADGTLTPLIAGMNGVSRSIIRPDRGDVAPRFGFAYKPLATSDFVIRGGYGLFYSQVITNVPFYLRLNPPFFATLSITNVPGSQVATLQNPFPSAVGSVSGAAYYVDPNIRDAYIQQWNLNIEKQIGSNIGVEIAYIGTKGSRLPVNIAENQATAGPGPIQSRRPDPNYNQLFGEVSATHSNYNGLQAKLERRMRGGSSVLLGYTFSKSLDEGSSSQGSTPQNSYDLAAEYGRSAYDVQQNFTGSYVWNLPFGKGHRWLHSLGPVNPIVSGWSATGIVTLQTGFPFSVALAENISNNGVGADRPNRIGKGTLPKAERSIYQWLDPTAFTLPAEYTYGNSGRDILSGPGLMNWDQGVMRDIPLGERQKLQIRFEAFNSLNHPNFGAPFPYWDIPSLFGTITSAGSPRNLQFAAKYIF